MKSIHRVPNKHYDEMGFTLIELSIVLVIIGLIVGGVLVGQDLIKAAETRATLSQIEKYNSAVNTFRNKYNGIPGDLLNANTTFGFQGGAGGTADRDGNGFIEACASLGIGAGCEPLYFWSDLQTAGFLDGSVSNGASGTTQLSAVSFSGSTISKYLPPAKLGKGNYVLVFYNTGYNWFGIGAPVASAGALTLSGTASTGLTPNQAFNMDKKVDDGQPQSGIVQALSKAAITYQATTWAVDTAYGTTAGADCVTAAGGTYNLTTSAGDVPACALGLRFN